MSEQASTIKVPYTPKTDSKLKLYLLLSFTMVTCAAPAFIELPAPEPSKSGPCAYVPGFFKSC